MSLALTLCATLGTSEAVAAAAGSWVGALPRQVVVASQRALSSDQVMPPAHLGQASVTRVSWRFDVEGPVQGLEAKLCQAELCVALDTTHGSTRRFAGRDAAQPLRFEFRLRPRSGTRAVISHGQIMVDFARGAPLTGGKKAK
ncbi:flagellar protein FlhE [Salinicola sp. JS01]|uniref:flagellar protein FlhE n=1 Tax=Salinicola sp. JS01 TaxID=3050071 RepID=UPI00255C2708|nr:flagellar protein FlhE [Salinicola sp. JS01]WIX34781.1 flagellar protein FlhE [Salinicola sp. JS01]